MCGRFAVDKKPEEIAEEVQAVWEDDPEGFQSWNTCPTSFTPVLSEDKLFSWSWGLIPKWAKDNSRRAGLINARVETLSEKPAFKDLIGTQQCVIPIDGYYEWQRKGETKIPYYFHREDKSMLLLAGLWDKWYSVSGNEVFSFTILTREASENIADIHDRMPIILNLENAKKWSSNNLEVACALDQSQTDLKFYEVGTAVNSVKNNNADLIKPTSKPQLWQDELF